MQILAVWHRFYWACLCLFLLVGACSTTPAPPSVTPTASVPAQAATIPAYYGHTSKVFAVAWSPDGRRIASASQGGTAQVWDATRGRHVLTYRGQTAPLWAVAWSPSGVCLASATGNTSDEHQKETVLLWNAATGHLLISDPVPKSAGEASGTFSVAWSHNGTRLASGALRRSSASGKRLFSVRGEESVGEALGGPAVFLDAGHGKCLCSGQHAKTRKDDRCMTDQDKPPGQDEQQRRGMLWRVLFPGTLLVTIIVVIGALRVFASPSASLFPLRMQAFCSPAHVSAHLETVADIPLPGCKFHLKLPERK